MTNKKQKSLIDGGVVSIEEVFAALDALPSRKMYMHIDGDKIKATSQRYRLFRQKGTTCVECGIQGKYFRKERFPADSRFHLNLYALDDEGNEVLMTKDHIIPKARGGPNTVANYQTMCRPCNEVKGDAHE